MWATTFLVAFWLTITPPSALITPTTDVMLVEFSKPMSTSGLFNTSNYTITDQDNNVVPIQSITAVTTLDGITIPSTTIVALVVPKIKDKTGYSIVVRNLKSTTNQAINLAKNTGYYYNTGFAPNLEQSPKLIIKE